MRPYHESAPTEWHQLISFWRSLGDIMFLYHAKCHAAPANYSHVGGLLPDDPDDGLGPLGSFCAVSICVIRAIYGVRSIVLIRQVAVRLQFVLFLGSDIFFIWACGVRRGGIQSSMELSVRTLGLTNVTVLCSTS